MTANEDQKLQATTTILFIHMSTSILQEWYGHCEAHY